MTEPPPVERPSRTEAERLQYAIGAIPSFLQQPHALSEADLDRWRPDVAILGAPFDLGVSNRPGARFGPRALRTQAYESGTYHLSHGVEITDWLTIVDHGDAHCPNGQIEASLANIRARVHGVARRGILPITVGGDHTVVWPALTGIADHLGYGRIGMLHFDAHADTAREIDGAIASHGTPMFHLVDSGAVRPDRFAQIGLRSHWPEEEVWDWMHEVGIRSYLMDEVVARGIVAVVDDAMDHVLTDCDAVYLSVDIDCLDPAFAPGTGTPEPGGLQARELLLALRRIARRVPLVGMDLVEVAPAYDHADVTVNAAHHAIVEVLAALAANRRDAVGGAPGRPARRD
jgi:agmatinase